MFAIKEGHHYDRIIMIGKITNELRRRKIDGLGFFLFSSLYETSNH